jgi:hypothetical protein
MASIATNPPRYLILRGHQEYGPYAVNTLWEGIATGQLRARDLVRGVEDPFWHSLGQFLESTIRGPSSESIARPSPVRIVLELLARIASPIADCVSLHAGWIALTSVVGALATGLFTDEPLHWEFPWLVAAIASGVAMIVQRRFVPGIVSCLMALIIPVVVTGDWLDDDDPPPSQIYSALAKLPSRKVAPSPLTKPVPMQSQIPALGLPQPTDTPVR